LIVPKAKTQKRKSTKPKTSSRKPKQPSTTKRAIWRGSITFGLISIPVGLHTAVEERDISFHMLSSKDHSRIRFKRVSSKTGREVEWDDIVRGYEYEKERYVIFTEEELERIPAESIRAIDVVQFTQQEQIDPVYFQQSYYVAPEETGIKAYTLLTKALEKAGRVGLAKVTIREKERLCVLRVKNDVLVLETMNWPDEIRQPAFGQLDKKPRISTREVDMAERLIDQLTEDFDPSRFTDEYREKLEEVIEAKVAGDEIELAPEEESKPEEVTDLMEALRASVEATRSKRSRKSA
jgi:DNA end-binding protein Ku